MHVQPKTSARCNLLTINTIKCQSLGFLYAAKNYNLMQ
jgi:hypothetical protein